MSVSETQYFALLRAALWEAPAVVEGPVDWKAVMQTAAYHGNTALLSDVAFRMADDLKPSPKMLVKMQTEMRGNLLHQMKMRQVLLPAVKLLREHGIEPVLLKGFGLASLYSNPSLRQFGDIDLYVGLDAFHEACSLLRTLPGVYFWCMEMDAGHHYNIEFGQYPMEIHRVSADVTDAEDHATYAGIERDGLVDHLQHIDLDGFTITIPSKEFVVFFTFFHAWHHYLSTGVGWRQLSDVAMGLHAYYGQLDLDKFRQWLGEMHLMQPWQTFGWLMVDRLGLPEVEMPFYDATCQRKARKLFRQIMKEGNFRRERKFKRRRPKRKLWQKWHSIVCVFIDFFRQAKVFPKQAVREFCTSLSVGLKKNIKKM